MNEYFALEQSRKSILSRIAKGKRGVPTAGALPYGRTFDRKTETWGIISDKKDQIVWASEQYLAGISMYQISITLGMDVSTLWDILKNKCGEKWVCNYRNKRVGICETITFTIPALLPQETIGKIHERCASNKTYTHGQSKNKYLLGRMIFCAHCGTTLYGVKHSKCQLSYYTHSWANSRKCDGPKSVRADYIEDAIVIQLLNLSNDVAAIERSHTDTFPPKEKIDNLQRNLVTFKEKIANIVKKRKKIINLIADEIFTMDDAKNNLEELRSQEEALTLSVAEISKELRKYPSQQKIKEKSKFVQNVLKTILKNTRATEANLNRMTWDEKRKLIQAVFSGKTLEGDRAGVYVRRTGQGVIEYELRGDLLHHTTSHVLPMSSEQRKELLNIFDPVYDLSPDDLIDQESLQNTVKQDCLGSG